MQSVGWQNKIFSSQFLGSTFWKEKIILLSKQRKKNCNFSSLCHKIEERLIRNSNQIIFACGFQDVNH